MNVDYINPFIATSVKVFNTFAQIKSIPGSPTVAASLTKNGFVNGFIGLDGHGISGYFVINFSQIFLRQLYMSLFDTQTISSKAELFDAAGELTNMISGGAKAELSQQGFFFDVDVPKIFQTIPVIPENLKQNPVILVPFETRLGTYVIQASILKIEEDFAADSMPEIKPPKGMISVAQFSEQTGMGKIKVRRFLNTGFLKGEKISPSQWHIPEKELDKIQVKKANLKKRSTAIKTGTSDIVIGEDSVNINEFSKLSGLSPAKIKGFLRSGFLKGVQDGRQIWHIKKSDASKFKKNI